MPDDIVAQAGLQFSRLAHDPALIRSALDLLRAWFDDPICAPQYDSIWAHVASGKADCCWTLSIN